MHQNNGIADLAKSQVTLHWAHRREGQFGQHHTGDWSERNSRTAAPKPVAGMCGTLSLKRYCCQWYCRLEIDTVPMDRMGEMTPELNRRVLVTTHQKTGRSGTAFATILWMMGGGLVASIGACHLNRRRLKRTRFHRRFIPKAFSP